MSRQIPGYYYGITTLFTLRLAYIELLLTQYR